MVPPYQAKVQANIHWEKSVSWTKSITEVGIWQDSCWGLWCNVWTSYQDSRTVWWTFYWISFPGNNARLSVEERETRNQWLECLLLSRNQSSKWWYVLKLNALLFYLTWSTELPAGEPCKKANQLAKDIAEVWKGMSNAQKKETVANGRWGQDIVRYKSKGCVDPSNCPVQWHSPGLRLPQEGGE